ncbi:UNC93-like protein 3 isoform X2 [Papaver somniferum]|nr:UNC93-like protein 3 isoform X2 [Papaver somniferum]
MDCVNLGDVEAPLIPGNTTQNYTKDVHILSCAFLLIFLAYGAAQNLQSTVNTEQNLGTTSLGISYVSFTFFSLFSSTTVRLLGSKNALILGTTGYWLYVAANLTPSWYSMGPAAIYLGFCASIIWVGQGTYLTSAARSHANDSQLHEGTVIGNFNGEFFGMFASRQFFGNFLTLALLRDGMEGKTSGTTFLFVVFLGSMTFGIILMFFLHERDDDGRNLKAQKSSLSIKVTAPLLDLRMLLIIPLIAYSGLQQAFVWAEFTKEVVKPALGVSGVGGAMAVYGAFDAICSLITGRLTSGLSSIAVITPCGAFVQLIVLLWILLSYSATSGVLGYVYPLLMAAMLGIGDAVFNTQLNALLGILFKDDTRGAFAQLKVWQSAAIAIVFFLSPLITLDAMLIIMITALFFGMACFFFLALHLDKTVSSQVLLS